MIESVIIAILRIFKYFKKETCQVGKDCPFIHSQKKNRSTGPQRKGKGEGNESEKEKVMVAIVNIANHRLRETSGTLVQFETSDNKNLQK